MRFLLAFGAVFLLALTAQALHAYHATLTELRYNAEKKQLELAIKVFTDDFEKALSRGQATPVTLGEAGPRPFVLTSAYLQRTLQLKTLAGAPLPLQYLGMQAEKDGYWLYCKVAVPAPLSGLQLRNTLLLELFGDEVNIVNIEAGSKKQSALFRLGHEEEVVKF
ncbi:hypothetical protein GCM10023185_30390 [Hymenobacter saemangeumensis]|uniref:Uncharacterized protein n=1 Tax=Hymenobacter saemangeumensis TaxID=1084522 RepID=A0ABP8ILV6_9BACT